MIRETPSLALSGKEEGRGFGVLASRPECHLVAEGHQAWPMETLTPFWEQLQHWAVSCAKHHRLPSIIGCLGAGKGGGPWNLGLDDTSCVTFFFFFCLFAFSRAAPAAYGGPQARGRIRAVATGLHQSHSNVGSEPPLRPTPQPDP